MLPKSSSNFERERFKPDAGVKRTGKGTIAGDTRTGHQRRLALFLEVLALLVILAAALPTPYANTMYDSGFYLKLALSIADGSYTIDGEPYTGRGPVYPALLSLLLGPADTLQSVSLFPRAAFSTTVLLIFLLLRITISSPAAWIAAAIMLATHVFHNTSTQFLSDYVLISFILLSLIILAMSALHSDSPRGLVYSALSGAVLGLAYLTKQSAILYVVAPCAVFLFLRPKAGRYLQLVSVYALAFFAVLAPWFVYVNSNTPGVDSLIKEILGRGGNMAAVDTVGSAMDPATAIAALRFFLADIPGEIFTYVGFAIAGVSYAVYLSLFGSIRQRIGGVILIYMAVSFMPLALFLSGKGFRAHQYLLFYITICGFYGLSIDVMFRALKAAGSRLLEGRSGIGQWAGLLRHGLVLPVVFIVLQAQASLGEIAPGARPTWWQSTPTIVGELSAPAFDAMMYANERLETGQTIIVGERLWSVSDIVLSREGRVTDTGFWLHAGSVRRQACTIDPEGKSYAPVFAWNGLRELIISDIPYWGLCLGRSLLGTEVLAFHAAAAGVAEQGNLIAVFTRLDRSCFNNDGIPRLVFAGECTLWMMEASSFLAYIQYESAQFLISTRNSEIGNVFYRYAGASPYLSIDETFGTGSSIVDVYSLNPLAMDAETANRADVHVTPRAREILDWLVANRPEVARSFAEDALGRALRIPDRQIRFVIPEAQSLDEK